MDNLVIPISLFVLCLVAITLWVLEMSRHKATKKELQRVLGEPIQVWCALRGGYKDHAALIHVARDGTLTAPPKYKRDLRKINVDVAGKMLGAPDWTPHRARFSWAFGSSEIPFVELLDEVYDFPSEGAPTGQMR